MRYNTGMFQEEKPKKHYDLKLLYRLLPFVGKYRHLLWFSVMLVIVITFCDLALPYVTKIAIDQYIVPGGESAIQEIGLKGNDVEMLRKEDLAGVARMGLILVLISGAGFVFNFMQVMIMEYTGQKVMHDLRMKIYNHIQSLSLSFFTKNPVGRLVTRTTNDIQNMHEMFTSIITFVFKDLFLLTGIAVVLLTINVKLALICFTVLPIVLFTALKFASYAREAFRTLRIKIAEINSKLSETIDGIRVIQLFRQEEKNRKDFTELNHEHYLAGMKQVRVFALFMPVIELLGSAAVAIIIYYGGGKVISQSITLGGLVAFISYMRMFFRPVRDIAEKFNILQNAMSSAERIFLILDNKEQLKNAHLKADPFYQKISSLEFKNVDFEYNPGETVLKNISFKATEGETIAFVGPTGAGKTSIINLIARFYDPLFGSVLLNGKDIRNFHPSSVRWKMALVTQDPFLFSGTIRDNIMQGNSALAEQDLENILAFSNCKYLVDQLPLGADTQIAGGNASMSSGERQLISIARAFAKNPDLILLDEATSYIDSESERHIQGAIERLMADRTSVIIAHRLSTAMHADRIITLNKGGIVETGTHDDLMKSKGFYYMLHKMQNSS